MKKKISFYKYNNEWFADVPFIPKANNMMVAGADTFLEDISDGKDRVTLTIITNPSGDEIERCAYYLKRTKHDFCGGTYDVYDGSTRNLVITLWLCNVTHFVCGHHPLKLVIINVDKCSY